MVFNFWLGMKGHDTARGDRDFFASLGIPSWTLRFVAQLKIPETG